MFPVTLCQMIEVTHLKNVLSHRSSLKTDSHERKEEERISSRINYKIEPEIQDHNKSSSTVSTA